MNRYTCVANNPVTYNDPNGYTKNDPKEIEEADNILQEMSCLGITIEKDLG